MSVVLVLLVAIAGGFAVTLQAQLAAVVDDRLGTVEAIFVTYGLGGVLAAVLLLAVRGWTSLASLRGLPPSTWLSGVCGLVIVGAISWTVARLGVVRGLLLVTVAQFLLSTVIDHFGWLGATVRPIDVPRVAGIVLLLAGGWLVLR